MQVLYEDTGYQFCTSSQESQEDKDDDNNSSVCESSLRYFINKSSESIIFRLNEVEELCRVCLNSGSIPIFGSVDISDDLERFANIEVRADDCLPQHICPKCQELLDNAIILWKIAQNTDKVLRRRAEEVDIESQESQTSVGKISTEEMVVKPTTVETSDTEDSDNGVYLEYADSANGSGNESETDHSNTEDNNENVDDAASNVESIGPDTEELKSLIDSFKKNAKWLQCKPCNITFRTAEQLEDHRSTHDPKQMLSCEVCSNIIHKNSYSIHLKLHKESYKQISRNQTVDCTICGKSYKKSYMKKHMNIHNREGKTPVTKCNICFKPFSVNYLNDHIKRLHSPSYTYDNKSQAPENKQKCPVCSLMVKESMYKNHLGTHTNRQKKYVCEECGKEMSTYSSFKTHLLTHKEVYKYKCQFCPYHGKHQGLLKVHVRTHTKDYAYQCSLCNARFITKSNLTAHIKIHSTGVQYVCAECGLSFASSNSLRRHKSKEHKANKAVSCNICGIEFPFRVRLLLHKRKIHQAPPQPSGRTPSYLLAAQNNGGGEVL